MVVAPSGAAENWFEENEATQRRRPLRKPFGNGASDNYNDDDGKAH